MNKKDPPAIDLYTAPTPNGWKASVMLEELGVPYTVRPVNLSRGAQKQRDYLKLNPNGRIPTLVDRDHGDFTVFESGAILIYLAEKYGKFLPKDVKGRSTAIQWVMFQMGGIGPMQGQANVFFRYWPKKIPEVIDRYQHETKRLYTVLDTRLKNREFLCDEFSIADIANVTWVHIHKWAGVEIDDLPNLKAWLQRLRARPALSRGLDVPGKVEAEKILAASRKIVQR